MKKPNLTHMALIATALATLSSPAVAADPFAKMLTVAQFLRACDAAPEECFAHILDGSTALILDGDKTYCDHRESVSEVDSAADVAAVKEWLRAHADGKNASAAILDGWRARYPCNKP